MAKLHIEDYIIEPLLTEKSTELSGKGKYVFKVHVQTNKPMVKTALEKMYQVKVDCVNIINQKGYAKKTRSKNIVTYTPKWKKAIITLRDGSFPFFETMK